MTIQEQLSAIEQLLPYKFELNTKGRTTFAPEHQQLLKQVYIDIYKPAMVNLGCSTCVNHYLAMLEAYYQRERSKLNPELVPEAKAAPTAEEQNVVDQTLLDEIKAPEIADKPARKRKKKD